MEARASGPEDAAAPQPREELTPWQHFPAVVHARAALVADEDRPPRVVIVHKGSQPTKLGMVDAAGALDLDGDLALAKNEIHFETALRAPEVHVVIQIPV